MQHVLLQPFAPLMLFAFPNVLSHRLVLSLDAVFEARNGSQSFMEPFFALTYLWNPWRLAACLGVSVAGLIWTRVSCIGPLGRVITEQIVAEWVLPVMCVMWFHCNKLQSWKFSINCEAHGGTCPAHQPSTLQEIIRVGSSFVGLHLQHHWGEKTNDFGNFRMESRENVNHLLP